MDQNDFSQATLDMEIRMERVNAQYHRCLGTVVEKWLNREAGFENVEKHCLDQKLRLAQLLAEY